MWLRMTAYKLGASRRERTPPRRAFGAGRSVNFEWLERRDLLTQIDWIGGATGDFNTGTNWQGGNVPGKNDEAFIGSGVTVKSSQSNEVMEVSCSGTLELDGGTFKVDNSNPNISTISNLVIKSGATFDANTGGAMVVNNGDVAGTLTVENTATVDITGNMNFHNAKLSGQGFLVVRNNPNGVVEFSGPVDASGLTGTLIVKQISGSPSSVLSIDSGVSFSVPNLEIDSGGDVSGAGSLTVTNTFNVNGGTLDVNQGTVAATATLTINGVNNFTLDGGTLTNHGTTNWTGGGIVLNGATINNDATWNDSTGSSGSGISGNGTFDNAAAYNKPAATGSTVIASNFHNTGTVSLGAGDIDFQPANNTADNSGTLSIQGAAILAVSNGTLALTGGTVTGNGTVYVIHSGILHITGAVTDSLNGTLYVGEAPGTVNPQGGVVTVDHDLSAANIEVDAEGTINGIANLTVTNKLNWAATSTMSGPGTTTVSPTATMTIAASDATLDGRTLANHGTVNWTGGTIFFRHGAIVNNYANFNDQADHQMEMSPTDTAGGSLHNIGTYTKTAGVSNGASTISIVVQNTGTMKITSGSLELDGPGNGDVSTGTFNLSGNGLIIGQGITTFQTGATVTGNGPLTINQSGTLHVDTTVPVAGNVVEEGTVELAPASGLTVAGSYTNELGSGNVIVDIAGSSASGQFGSISVAGAASLGGTLNVNFINGFQPGAADSYHVMTFASETGTLVGLQIGALTLTVNPTNVTLSTSSDPNALYVTAVYGDVLGREPDPSGLQYWTQLLDNGTAVSAVAEAIAHSAEYYGNFVIKPAYLSLLGRAADDAGVNFWTQNMLNGLTDQQLEAGFVASDEFYANAGGTNTKWIDAIYKLLLGRNADSAGEQFWDGQLSAGQTRLQVAERIAGSTENNTQLINGDYDHYLGRPADPGGLSYWLGQFAVGQTNEDIIAGFTGSAEYYQGHS